MNLIDRNFPDELGERAKNFSGRVNLTDAVKDSLQRLLKLSVNIVL